MNDGKQWHSSSTTALGEVDGARIKWTHKRPRSRYHKASFSSLCGGPVHRPESILVCDGAPSVLGMMVVPLFLQRCLGDGRG